MKMLRLLGDRAAAVAVIAAGLGVLLAGWIGVSGTAYPAEQLPYLLSGGVFATVLIGIGATVWLSSDLHDEWRQLDRIEELLRDHTAAHPEAGQPAAATNGSSTKPVRTRTASKA